MKFSLSSAIRPLASFFMGLIAAFAFAASHLAAEKYSALDRFALIAVPAFSIAFILYALFPVIAEKARELDLANLERWRLALAALFGAAASFLVAGFLGYFYRESYQLVGLTLLSQWALGVLAYYALGRARSLARRSAADFGITAFLFVALFFFTAATFKMNLGFPRLFKADVFLLERERLVLFLIFTLPSPLLLAWTLRRLQEPRVRSLALENKIVAFVRENLSGLALSACFFYLYLLNGSVLNFPLFDVDDIFFDADGFIWRYRLTTEHWQDFYWRAVHPLALLILKSLTNFLAIFLNGDLHFAAIALTALAGAACVFLAWMFMRGVLENNPAALIMASLLGLSASHLFFGSLIETYIFLAALTLFCFVLMQSKRHSLPLWLAIGVATLGITLTNFAQTVIAVFCSKPDFKFAAKYVSLVLALTVSLMLVGNVVYPNASPYFFVPSSLLAESENMYAPSTNRVVALVRAFAFNNFAAPTPLTSYKDIPFTQFRFYRPEEYALGRYVTPLQYATEKIWIALLVLAAIFFVKDFKSHPPNLTLALTGCLLVNLVIHLRYGRDFFLYSSNWTYAVTLALGISWKSLLQRSWFQVALIAFLILLTANNLALFYLLMEISAPYVH